MLLHLPKILATLTQPDARPAIALATTKSKLLRTAGVIEHHNGAHIIEAIAEEGDGELPSLYTILGYRQTEKPACKGGRANANFFRIRHKSMRAFARTFKTKPFITGHDWGDVRARGGTITKSWAQTPKDAADELGIYCALELTKPWAKEGFADGSIDRFSMGAIGLGEITCTIHEVPLWSIDECWCWPGIEIDGMLCELEYEDARGEEMSGVNVPAVDGTAVIDDNELAAIAADDPKLAAAIADLQKLCGRSIPGGAMDRILATAGGAPRGGFPRAARPLTMAAHATRSDLMDRALLCQSLGLPATSTDEEIAAKLRELAAAGSQVAVLQAQLGDISTARERDQLAAHVESEITRLRAARQVGDQVIATLRAAAAAPNTPPASLRANFDASLRLVEASAPIAIAAGAAPLQRALLQSDARPAITQPAPGAPGSSVEIDAYDQHKANPELPRMMKLARLTPDDVRKHGATTFNVVPNLRELADATAARGA